MRQYGFLEMENCEKYGDCQIIVTRKKKGMADGKPRDLDHNVF